MVTGAIRSAQLRGTPTDSPNYTGFLVKFLKTVNIIIAAMFSICSRQFCPASLPDKMFDFHRELGFRAGQGGVHTSRTIMLAELRALFFEVGLEASKDEYIGAIVEENVLGKSTASTRKITARRLCELYGCDRREPVFKGLCRWWESDVEGQPVLALLAALARDPLLRVTMPAVLLLSEGQDYSRSAMADAIRTFVGARLNDATLDKVVRNTASSWTQSGHLLGRALKSRVIVKPLAGTVSMALFLGYLQGIRGKGLFQTQWCEVLDSTPADLTAVATTASRRGLIKFRRADDIIDVSFADLLTVDQLELIHE